MVICHLRSFRLGKGLSQSDLAQLAGVKRQAIYDIESGRYLPNTALALRLAKNLGCRVEDLFVIDEPAQDHPITVITQAGQTSPRVSVAKVRDQLLAFPLDGKWMIGDGLQAADGLLQAGGRRVHLLQREEQLARKALVLGCDPAFSVMGEHISRLTEDARLQCRFASSYRALEELAAGHAHVAASHLHNPGPYEANLELARKMLAGLPASIIAFSLFEEGLMVAPGNPYGIRTVADLATAGIRFVNRDPGAALRVLLDERLNLAGIPSDRVSGYHRTVSSHLEGAQMVAFDMADAALGLRAIAMAYGLDFVLIEVARCDLVIPHDFLEHSAVKITLDVLQSSRWRQELASLPGYEASATGRVIGEV